MLCTFTTEHGALIIRSDDIRAISDGPNRTLLRWDVCGTERSTEIIGTAMENRDRIQQEELDLIGRVEMHRFKMQQLLQAQPTPRGKQAAK